MKYALLVRKLNTLEEKYMTSREIKGYCSLVGLEYYDAITYLTRHRHLHTILKGIFYKPSIAERKLKSTAIDYREALAEALRMKGIHHWYFGLETAAQLNGLTHEFFAVDTIINDVMFRARPLTIMGNRVRFVKVKQELTGFGMKKTKHFSYSNVEKTVLDMVYLKRYHAIGDEALSDAVAPLLGHCSKEKLNRYAKKYNGKIMDFAKTS